MHLRYHRKRRYTKPKSHLLVLTLTLAFLKNVEVRAAKLWTKQKHYGPENKGDRWISSGELGTM